MPKCKDCLHYDVCHFHIDEETNMTVAECDHFKNKADFVEVVRCKECIHFEAITLDSGISVGLGNCENENGINLYTNETDFCSYGERSDT